MNEYINRIHNINNRLITNECIRLLQTHNKSAMMVQQLAESINESFTDLIAETCNNYKIENMNSLQDTCINVLNQTLSMYPQFVAEDQKRKQSILNKKYIEDKYEQQQGEYADRVSHIDEQG